MPTDVANQIVNHIFGDEKAKAVDATNDALAASAYDAIQAKKLDFAKQWGFNPDQTGQAVADELADKATDTGDVTDVDYEGRKPEDPDPNETVEQPTASAEEPTEEPKDETNS